VTLLDAVVVGWIVLWAALGAARGMTDQVLSLVGMAAGAVAGSRLAPLVLPDGRESIYLPLAALAGAVVGAAIVQAVLLRVAAPLRRRMARPPLRRIDTGGGLLVGAALGAALAWLVAAVAVYGAGDRAATLRDQVHRSAILRTALRTVPPDTVLGALARVDPFPLLPIPAAALPEPDPSVLASPGARAARGSVVQVRGRACGIVKQGSGWVADDGLVVTNAHVIAGEEDTLVLAPDGAPHDAQPVYVSARDDVAVLRVDGLAAPRLVLAGAPERAESVVLLGFPGGGPLTAEAATAAPPRTVLGPDAYGRGLAPRSVVVTRGSLGPGSSGGPVVDAGGRVVAMIFGGTEDGDAGAAVPPSAVRRALRSSLAPVDAGPCA
jgi:S1-C subfamily serine protease